MQGLQSGVASFALLSTSSIDEEARRWIQQTPKKHWAAFEIPVIFDLNDKKIYCFNKSPFWGKMYYGFFRDFIEKYFTLAEKEKLVE